MKYFILIVVLLVSGCDAPPEAKSLVHDKHAQLYVWVQRIDSPNPAMRPTNEQNAEMIKAILKDFESLDKVINNWKKNSTIDEVDLHGNDATFDEIISRYSKHEVVLKSTVGLTTDR